MASMAAGERKTAIAEMTPEAQTVEFISACKTGKYGLAKAMIVSETADVHGRDASAWSPLLWASFNGHHRIVQLLLEHGAAQDWREENGIEDALEMTQATDEDAGAGRAAGQQPEKRPVNSPLHWAVYRGHLRVVWVLLQAGFSTMDVDDRGNTALHLAAMHGDEQVIRAIMMAGVQVRQLNLDGNDPLAVASTPGARELLRKAAEQRECPGSRDEFGPRQPQFLCFSTGHFFSDEASNQVLVPAFADVPGVKRPVRVSNEREYEIRDAQSALIAALNPHGDLSTHELMGENDQDMQLVIGDEVTGLDDDDEGQPEASPPASVAGAPPPSPGPGPAPPGMRKGIQLGVASIVEEGEEEEDEEEDDEEGGTARGGMTARSDDDGGGVETGEEGQGTVEALAAEADAEPEAEAWPADRDEGLDASELDPLRRALEAAEGLSASVWLVARGRRALARVTAWAKAEREAEAVTRRRPLGRAAETAPLREAIEAAAALGVDDRLERLADVARAAEAECLVRDLARVCSTIPLATHDDDSDLQRLAAAIDTLTDLDPESGALEPASALSARLGVEVELSDSVAAMQAAVADAEKTFADCRDEDPTVLPLPEPTPEELEAKAKAEAEAAAAKAAAAAKPKPRGGKAAAAEPEPEEEPLPPMYPSPQLQAVEAIQGCADAVKAALGRAQEAGADESLIEETGKEVGEVEGRREALWEDEVARIRVFEAERIKREKKSKKKKKKKKK